MAQRPRVDDDDDFDDLDDVLDQFSPPAQPSTGPPANQPAPASSFNQPPPDDGIPAEFASQLAEGMESLFRELRIDQPAGSAGTDEASLAERERFAAAWEAMLIEEMDGMSQSLGHMPAEAASASSPQPREDDFRSNIQSTINRLRESESGLQASDSTAGDGSNLQSLLSQLEGLGDVAENEEELQGMLESIMGQLMGKDMLYDTLKELYDKFPNYLDKNRDTMSPEDKERYEAQISCIKRLLDEFEKETYQDDDERSREKIVELMSELQSHGSPPEEIMGPLPPGFNMGADGLPNFPDGCNLG